MDKNSIYSKQVQLLVRVLPLVNTEECFALKGGTAINLFFQDLPRLSVDIDLAYLPIEDRETSLKNIHQALKRIAALIEKTLRGVVVHQANNKQDELRLIIRSDECQIKLELSPVLRGTVWPVEQREISESADNLFGYAEVQTVSENDLYAGKICAALDRQHPRDMFDVMLFLRNVEKPFDRELIQTFIVYLIGHPRPIAEILAPRWKDISALFVQEFETMAVEEVTLNQLIQTRDELLQGIQAALTNEDKEFLLSFKKGEPDWNKLGLRGIAELPAVKWKMLNLDRMGAQKREQAFTKLKSILDEL